MLGLKPRVIVIAARSSRQWFSFEVFILKSGVCFYRVYFKSGVNIWEAEMALPYWLNNPSRVSCRSPLLVFIPLWVGWALVNRPVQSAERERERVCVSILRIDANLSHQVCVSVCVWVVGDGERERERQFWELMLVKSLGVCVWVCGCERESA